MNKVFLDSNVLIYLYSSDQTKKQLEIEQRINGYEHIVISTQVLFEFSYVMHRKLKIDYSSIGKALKEFEIAFEIAIIRYDLLQNALKIASRYKYSFPDSLILATALDQRCTMLLSEDMHDDQNIEGNLKIINPFKDL